MQKKYSHVLFRIENYRILTLNDLCYLMIWLFEIKREEGVSLLDFFSDYINVCDITIHKFSLRLTQVHVLYVAYEPFQIWLVSKTSDFTKKHIRQQISKMKGSSETYRGPLAVLTKVAENTSLHGIPNAYRARSGIRKAIWSVLFMAGFGESTQTVSQYGRLLIHIENIWSTWLCLVWQCILRVSVVTAMKYLNFDMCK